MKILYCGMDENLGGIESFIINMYRKFNKDKIQIDFLKITDTIYYEKELVENGSVIYKIPSRRENPIKFFLYLVRFFKNHPEYNIVHHHLNSCSSIEPIIIARLYGRKTIAHIHNEFKGDKFLTRVLHSFNKRILPYFSNVNIACSKDAGESVFNNRQFTILNNGIDLEKYEFNLSTRKEYRSELGLSGKFVVGHIGRFKFQKNHDFLIDIFKEILYKESNAVLLLIGDGPLRADIEKKLEQLNLSDNVIITGVRHDIPGLLQAMDTFVFPSRYEGLGIVLIEAQAAGLSSIVADTIPKEAIITNLVKVVPLDKNAKYWSNKIIGDFNNHTRKSSYEEIRTSGFDSITSSRILEELYLIQ